MTTIEVAVPCPHCRQKHQVPLAEIGQGKSHPCPNCGTIIAFAGPDGGGIQRALDQLGSQLGGGAVKVTVKTRVRRPWWKLWRA